jgi:Growth regulator
MTMLENPTMRSQFAMWGNSLAVRIPNDFAREIAAKPGTPVEVTIRDGALVLEPIGDAPSYTLDELLGRITDDNLHDETSTGDAIGHEFS